MSKSKSNVNEKELLKLNTPESAYILGFIWGDGYLLRRKRTSNIIIECIKEDIDEIKHTFNLFGKWTYSTRKRKNRREQAKLSVSNKEFYNFLISKNYKNKSGGNHKLILDSIPKELRYYWLRGLSDADGCFYFNEKQYIRQFSLASTFNQDWIEIENIFKSLDIKYSIIRRKKTSKNNKISKSSCIRITNKKDIKKFGNYIYNGKQFGLLRKQLKYNQIINETQNKCFRMIEFNGRKQKLSDWAKELNITVQALYRRLNINKWSIEKALTTKKRICSS